MKVVSKDSTQEPILCIHFIKTKESTSSNLWASEDMQETLAATRQELPACQKQSTRQSTAACSVLFVRVSATPLGTEERVVAWSPRAPGGVDA
eukprot:1148284-Pelagomonas_calceolata.AAC.3